MHECELDYDGGHSTEKNFLCLVILFICHNYEILFKP